MYVPYEANSMKIFYRHCDGSCEKMSIDRNIELIDGKGKFVCFTGSY